MFSPTWLLFWGLVLWWFTVPGSGCPVGCVCSRMEGGKYTADCKNQDLKEIMSADSLINVTKLELSSNKITSIRSRAFIGRRTLKKLFISRNKISTIEPGAFGGLEKLSKLDLSHNEMTLMTGQIFTGLRGLKVLDLSHNRLNFINTTVFNGLTNLRRLDLSSNKFITIPEGTLGALNLLEKLDISSNDLLCDCQLKWIVQFRKDRSVNIRGGCAHPTGSKFKKIAKINQKSFKCGKLTLPFYKFKPKNDAVGFFGDSFTITCGTTWIPGLHINWYKHTKLLIPDSPNTSWKIKFYTDFRESQVISTLRIAKLNTSDTGKYQCNVSTAKSFILGESRLRVLRHDSKFCHAEVTKTWKGVFHWEDTDVGVVAQVTCPAGHARESFQGAVVARRRCSQEGKWMGVDAKRCAYVDMITQTLYNLKQVAVNTSTVLRISKDLLNVTKQAKYFETEQDVIYAAEILNNIRTHLNGNDKIGKAIVGIVSNVMGAKKELLAEAQRKERSCSSMIVALDALVDLTPSPVQIAANNVGVDVVTVYPATFQGKTCATFLGDNGNFKSILCNLPWHNETTFDPSKPLEASVHLPPYMFGKRFMLPSTETTLQFTVYNNSKLFPNTWNGTSQDHHMRITTSVVCFQFGMQFTNLTYPMAIKFRNHQGSKESSISVNWDMSGQGGIGAWFRNTDCDLTWTKKNTIARCSKLMDNNCIAVMTFVDQGGQIGQRGEDGLTVEPIVYIGAAVCVLLLLVTLVTYIMFRKLRYNRDDAAMLMNECLALLLVVVIFVVGINRVTNTLMCRAIGVLLHYFLLCCLLWIGCGGLCLCRLIRTAIEPEEFNPVLRYYMISWGIPLIICGITVAGNPENYNVDNYCWLKPNPFLGAFVGPACLIILVDFFMYIRLHNLVKNTYSPQTHNTLNPETVSGQFTDEQHLCEAVTSNSELVQHIEQLLPDKEEIVAYQKGSLLVLLLIIANFALAYLVVHFQQPRYLSLLLSCVYAIANILLGLVVFLFHCYKNPKARKFWTECCWNHICDKKKYIIDQEEVENTDAPCDKDTGRLMNGNAVRHNGGHDLVAPIIHGAPSITHGSDIQSNVSLPSSAALTIDRPLSIVERCTEPVAVVEDPCSDRHSLTAGSDKHSIATSVSDRQSCASAPLPVGHTPPKLREHPPGYRYSYCVPDSVEFSNVKPKKKTHDQKAPIAMPEKNGITSSMESSMKLRTERNRFTPPSKKALFNNVTLQKPPLESAPSEQAPSELSSVQEQTIFLATPCIPYSSCASSEVSVPAVSGNNFETRPPIPGASDIKGNAMATVPPLRGKSVAMPTAMERYPHAMFGRGTYNFVANAGRPPRYPPSVPYPQNKQDHQRYVPVPSHFNGVLRHTPREQTNITLPARNTKQLEQQPVAEHPHKLHEHNPHGGPVNGIHPKHEQNIGPVGVPRPNGPITDHLPRRRPRDRSNSDRQRSNRRYKEAVSQPKSKEPSGRFGSRSSTTSWREEKGKPQPKDWVPETVSRVTYVPVPHISKQHNRNETSV